MKIEDIAKAMIEILAPKFGRKASDIKIEVKGKREGEKIYELLMTDEEAENVYENDLMLCLTKKPVEGFKSSGLKHYRSDEVKLMNYDEVLNYMKDYFKKREADV
jgi:FlaA1/EpsC-like NDP-sugar epimerase